ncbi:MAG: HTH-type transcriptional regulator TreR [Candidatus Erwinia impunctatus]|nr:HTH-type transcriptional regulator TreR [Culicoides impunctatus]
MMQNRLTIKDIALLCGVGKSTVSRVINGGHGVNPDTCQRVRQVIAEQRFTPSKSARSMRGGSEKVIAIIVSRLDSPSESQAVRAMLPLLYQHGYDPIVLESQFQTERVDAHLQVLSERNIDGVIVFGFTGLQARQLTGWQDKIVLMARPLHGFSSVCYDDAGAISSLMERLITDGSRHISFVGVAHHDTTTGKRRAEAYSASCQQHGLHETIALGDLSYQSGFELLFRVLKPETQAIICASDTIAIGVCKALQQTQSKAIQVCCIGSNPLLHFLFPDTLQARLGYHESGKVAVTQLIGQLTGNLPHRQLIMPLESPLLQQ